MWLFPSAPMYSFSCRGEKAAGTTSFLSHCNTFPELRPSSCLHVLGVARPVTLDTHVHTLLNVPTEHATSTLPSLLPL